MSIHSSSSVFSIEPLVPEEASPARAELIERSKELMAADHLTRMDGVADVGNVRIRDWHTSCAIEGDVLPRGAVLPEAGGAPGHRLTEAALRETHASIHEAMCAAGLQPKVRAGAFRTCHVKVGRHVPPAPDDAARLLSHMARMYRMQGPKAAIIAAICAHHRLLWVHPFEDLNGRVGRLVLRAMLEDALGGDLRWSPSSALLHRQSSYMKRMAAADDPRHGGADGRGALSQVRLEEFARFMMETLFDEACRSV